MTPLANYLRDELARRDWSIDEFAKKAGLSLSNAYLIIRDGKDNVRRETLAGIAAALSMSPSELLAAVEAQTGDDLFEQAIRQRTAEIREIVDGTPRAFWKTIIDKTFDRALDNARDMAALLAAQRTAVTSPDEPQVTTPERAGINGDAATDPELRNWKQVHAMHGARLGLAFVTPVAVASR